MKRMAVCSVEADHFIRAKRVGNISVNALRVKFDKVLPHLKLQSSLSKDKSSIKKCLTRKEKEKLYPSTGIVSSNTMDLTLMVKVLRNTKGINKPSLGFDCKPNEKDISPGDDVARLKYIRNQFAHTTLHELNGKEYEEITQTLIEVIRRFSGSLFDNEIRCIMEESLDYRTGRLTWHVHAVIALAPNAINETLIKPTKVSVVQLYEYQPLYYSIYGGPVLIYGMTKIFETQSLEELMYYLSVVHDFTVRQCIFILNEHPFLKEKLAELILGQETPVGQGCMTVENVNISASNSTPTSVLPGLHSQCGQVSSRPCVMDSSCTNGEVTEALLRKQHFNKHYTKENCKLVEQQRSTSHSHCIHDSPSAESPTKVECCNSPGLNIDKNLDSTCQMELQSEFSSSSQLSRNNTDGYQLMNNELETALALKCPEPLHSRDRANSPVNTDCPEAIQSDLNDNSCCSIYRSEVIEIAAPTSVTGFFANLAIFTFFLYTIAAVYISLWDYYKSRFIAASLTVLFAILELCFFYFVQILYYYIRYRCLGLVYWTLVCVFLLYTNRPRVKKQKMVG